MGWQCMFDKTGMSSVQFNKDVQNGNGCFAKSIYLQSKYNKAHSLLPNLKSDIPVIISVGTYNDL